jgi:hypothetical protein
MTYLAIKLIIFAVAAIGVGLKQLSVSRYRAAIRAKMLAAPRTFEDNALVTLTGTAKLVGEPLIAPLSGRSCIAFRATARTYKTPRGRTKIAEIDQEATEIAMTPFVLVTDNEEILVDGTVCELPIRSAPVIPRKLDRERDFMIKAALVGLPKDAGFDEVVIETGAKIMVHGIARKELAREGSTGGETGFREAPTKIRITGDRKNLITIDFA